MSTSTNVKSSNKSKNALFRKYSREIDAASKICGVCLAVFWVVQYTIDVIRSDQNMARNEAIGYIKRFSEGEILKARLSLLDFWQEREDLAKQVVSGNVTRENYEYILLQQLDTVPDTSQKLKLIGYFFDELYYCYSSEICNQKLVKSFFCNYANGYEITYFSTVRKITSSYIGRDLYLGVNQISNICPK